MAKEATPEEVRNLQAQYDQLQNDIPKIEKWVRDKEKFVDDLQKKGALETEAATKRFKELDAKQKEAEKAVKLQEDIKASNATYAEKLKNQTEAVEAEKQQAVKTSRALEAREKLVQDREDAAKKREIKINSIFDEILELRK